MEVDESVDFLVSVNEDDEIARNDGCFCCSTICNFIFEKISNFLFGSTLQPGSGNDDIIIFDDESILDMNMFPKDSNLFLNYIDHEEFNERILKYRIKNGIHMGFSIEELLENKGFKNLLFDYDTSDNFVHKLHVFNDEMDSKHLLCQLFVRVDGTYNANKAKRTHIPLHKGESFAKAHDRMLTKLGFFELDFLNIVWLRLQDYSISSSKERLKLPGQNYPGLGIGREIEEMLISFVTEKQRDGVYNTPEFWHNAYLYFISSEFHFLNPAFEGFFRSICQAVANDLKKRGLSKVAWAIAQGKVIHAPTGESVKWTSMEQVYPISKRMKKYFESMMYANIVRENYHPEEYYIQWDDHHDNHEHQQNDDNKQHINQNNQQNDQNENNQNVQQPTMKEEDESIDSDISVDNSFN